MSRNFSRSFLASTGTCSFLLVPFLFPFLFPFLSLSLSLAENIAQETKIRARIPGEFCTLAFICFPRQEFAHERTDAIYSARILIELTNWGVKVFDLKRPFANANALGPVSVRVINSIFIHNWLRKNQERESSVPQQICKWTKWIEVSWTRRMWRSWLHRRKHPYIWAYVAQSLCQKWVQ